MRRGAICLFIALAAVALPELCYAQVTDINWSDAFDLKTGKMARGPGFYLSWIKIVSSWLVFLGWVATTDWVSVSAQQHRLRHALWNPLVFFIFVGAFLASWLIPIFWVGFPLLFLAWIVPLICYVNYFNKQVEPHHRVMTPDHLRFVASERLRPLGIKIDATRKRADEMGPPVKFVPRGAATDAENNANLYLAKQSPAYLLARELIAEALGRRAEMVMLDYTQQAVAVRYEIDGVWHEGNPRDRESGDAILAIYKQLAALKPAERRARQQGSIGIESDKSKLTCQITSQGTKTGERVLLLFEPGGTPFRKIADLGMRDKLQEQLQQLLAETKGFILVSAPPRAGLTTTYNAVVTSADRYVRSFVAVEDAGKNEVAVENVPPTTYNAAAGETPMTVLPKLARAYPDVICIRDLVNAETVDFLCEQVDSNRLIITSIRAKEAVEALLRVLLLKVPADKFAPRVLAVVNERLLRKLCETCREAYAPTPQVLQQLRIPAGKVEAFYRVPQQREEVCPDCGGIGYRGRAAIFELLVLNDDVRAALIKTPKLDVLRQVARKAGMRGLQEEGILLVARGVTSLQELMRVLKE
ncbi:MAG: Flp pilus assembly complex ATPase component TadA [Planctomycetaceae bacterium]|nr:Flp pilus assembly complex ATPase component TadA [Planctomycetaceae bacterium]